MKSRLARLAPWLLLGGLLLLRCYNASLYPSQAGLDAHGHHAYLDIILEQRVLPGAADSWATYHPPGYYLLSATCAWLVGWAEPPMRYEAAKLVSALGSLLGILAVYAMARRLTPQTPHWSTLFFAAIPVAAMMSAMVYNGALALTMVTIYLALIVWFWEQPPSLLSEASLALSLGLAVLTRTDAAVLGALLVWRSLRLAAKSDNGSSPARIRLEAGLGLLLSLTLLGAITGWFFQRNIADFGKPLVSNVSSSTFPIIRTAKLGLPGFFKTRFLVDAGGSVWLKPESPEGMSSVPASLYASFWTDHTGGWPSRSGLSRLRLLAGLPLTVICLLGFLATYRKPAWYPLFGAAALNLGAALLLLVNLPTYSGLKSVYLYPCFAVWSLCFGSGIHWLGMVQPRLGRGAAIVSWLCFAFLAYSLSWQLDPDFV